MPDATLKLLLSRSRRRQRKNKNAAAEYSAIATLLFVAASLTTVHLLFVTVPALRSKEETKRKSGGIESIGYLFVLSLWLLCFVRTRVVDPGGIPNTSEWTESPIEKKIFERDADGLLRFNEAEQKYIPDRAHFDRQSRRCILRMDHYCPWVGNAIGFYNYKFFHLILFYSWIFCLWSFVSFFLQILRDWTDLAVGWGVLYLLLLADLLSLYALAVALPFWLFHIMLISRNMTTIEWMEGQSVKWDRGSVYKNFKDFYGTNVILWFVPFGKPPGDGLFFKRRSAE